MPVLTSIIDVIGGTPLVRLEKLSRATGLEILAKIEGLNPAGSVKDRIARAMVDDAEQSGRLAPGATIVEPTSGNTGIALAMISAARGYRLVLTMPEAMSRERVALLQAYGAEVILTRGTLMLGAVEQAEALGRSTPGAVMLRQFENPANPRAHEQTPPRKSGATPAVMSMSSFRASARVERLPACRGCSSDGSRTCA
jgi:cysteine synthase A